MIAGSLDLDALAVEQESFVDVEMHRAGAESRRDTVDLLATRADCRECGVEMRGVGRPEVGPIYCEFASDRRTAARRDFDAPARRGASHFDPYHAERGAVLLVLELGHRGDHG